MAAETGNSWTDFFVGLPPSLQGVFVVIVAGGVGWAGYRQFFRGLRGEGGPSSSDFAVGEPTTFADMSSVKNLVKNVDLLCLQMMKSAMAAEAQAAHTAKLCDLVGQLLVDLRDQREEKELNDAHQRGYDEAMREKPGARRAPRVRRKPPA
jgi:hypothetical protein